MPTVERAAAPIQMVGTVAEVGFGTPSFVAIGAYDEATDESSGVIIDVPGVNAVTVVVFIEAE